MSDDQNKNHLEALRLEVAILKTMLEPHDTGHIHTAISVLEHRIGALENSSFEPYPKIFGGR